MEIVDWQDPCWPCKQTWLDMLIADICLIRHRRGAIAMLSVFKEIVNKKATRQRVGFAQRTTVDSIKGLGSRVSDECYHRYSVLLRNWLNSALFGQEAGKLDMLIRLACRLICTSS